MVPTEAALAQAGRPLILIVDDKPEQLRALHALLSEDYRLALAQSGQAGWHRAQALQPDAILLDVALPDIDGYAVCRLLKNDPATAGIPVLFLSERNQPDERVHGLALGAVDFVGKPFHVQEVRARVRVHLAHGREPRDAAGPQAERRPRSPQAVIVQAVQAHIREHLDELPPVDALARLVGLGEKRLLALFHAELGLTVAGFVREERMRTGARLLAVTAMPVREVALAVGFGNPGNFATAFRQHHGRTPQAWRAAQCSG